MPPGPRAVQEPAPERPPRWPGPRGWPRPRGARPGRALSDRLPVPWAFPLIVFAITWLLILAAWHGSAVIYGQGHPSTCHFLFKDAGSYLGIAEHGYPVKLRFPWTGGPVAGRAAFFPLFPLLIRLTSHLTGGDYPIAGLIVSILAGTASAVGVWALAARVRDRRVADRAVVLYCFFPGAMTFGMLYSEPLAVALGAAALLALVERRWLLAGILGTVGTAERPTRIVLTWLRRSRRPGDLDPRVNGVPCSPRPSPRSACSRSSAISGTATTTMRSGSRPRRTAGTSTSTGGFTRSASCSGLTRARPSTQVFNLVLIIMFISAVAGIAMTLAARLPLPVTLFGVLVVLMSVIAYGQSTKPRFVWSGFTLFIGAAAKLPKAIYWPVVVLSAAGLVFLSGWRPLTRTRRVVGMAMCLLNASCRRSRPVSGRP